MPESAPLPEARLELPLTGEGASKYLIFRLAQGEFGISIHKVREVLEMQEITSVPNAPAFIAGVINLRGKVIPVVDLRLSFGLHCEAPTPETCIVVVRVMLAATEQVLGILVDAVIEVLHLQPEDFIMPEEFQQTSGYGGRDPAPYPLGFALAGGKFKLLIDIEAVLNHLDPQSVPVRSAAA